MVKEKNEWNKFEKLVFFRRFYIIDNCRKMRYKLFKAIVIRLGVFEIIVL